MWTMDESQLDDAGRACFDMLNTVLRDSKERNDFADTEQNVEAGFDNMKKALFSAQMGETSMTDHSPLDDAGRACFDMLNAVLKECRERNDIDIKQCVEDLINEKIGHISFAQLLARLPANHSFDQCLQKLAAGFDNMKKALFSAQMGDRAPSPPIVVTERQIVLKLIEQYGNKRKRFRCSVNMQMGGLKSHYAVARSMGIIAASTMYFRYNDLPVSNSDTPRSLNMKDGDVIVVMRAGRPSERAMTVDNMLLDDAGHECFDVLSVIMLDCNERKDHNTVQSILKLLNRELSQQQFVQLLVDKNRLPEDSIVDEFRQCLAAGFVNMTMAITAGQTLGDDDDY